jgi:F-type H+-transporting ATPase subunit epsilon
MAGTFHVSVITPERAVLDTEATFAAFPGWDGEVGVLHNRAPLLYRLGSGLLRVEGAEGKYALFVDGGFAQMVDNRLTILTERTKDIDAIDRAAAEEELKAAEAMDGTDELSYRARQRALASARAQIRLAR